MALLIRENGTLSHITPANGKDFKLEELQKMVDGFIEIISVNLSDRILVINEEGKFTKGINFHATSIANIFKGDFIAGDVVYCESAEVE